MGAKKLLYNEKSKLIIAHSKKSARFYRYGFNGKEKDPEVYGEGNIYDYGFRIYNPRLGKFLSEDPLTSSYPWYTPYQFAGNMPIIAIDLDGLEEYVIIQYTVNGKFKGYGIKYLGVPKASDVAYNKALGEKSATEKKITELSRSFINGDIKKKAYYKEKAILDSKLEIQRGKVQEENVKRNKEQQRLNEKNKGKAVYLQVEKVPLNGQEIISTMLPITVEDIVGEPIVDLDPGTKKMLKDESFDDVATFNNTIKKDGYGIYWQIPSLSFSATALFSTDSYELMSQGKTSLDKMAIYLMANPGMVIDITGYTDNQGNEKHNKELSTNRANAVKDYLISKGVNPSQIGEVTGEGSSNPVSTNDNESGREQNRRIEINQQ